MRACELMYNKKNYALLIKNLIKNHTFKVNIIFIFKIHPIVILIIAFYFTMDFLDLNNWKTSQEK